MSASLGEKNTEVRPLAAAPTTTEPAGTKPAQPVAPAQPEPAAPKPMSPRNGPIDPMDEPMLAAD